MKAFSLLVSISKMFFWESSIRVWGQYPQLTAYVYLFNFLLEETFIALVNFRSQSQFQSQLPPLINYMKPPYSSHKMSGSLLHELPISGWQCSADDNI